MQVVNSHLTHADKRIYQLREDIDDSFMVLCTIIIVYSIPFIVTNYDNARYIVETVMGCE